MGNFLTTALSTKLVLGCLTRLEDFFFDAVDYDRRFSSHLSMEIELRGAIATPQ